MLKKMIIKRLNLRSKNNFKNLKSKGNILEFYLRKYEVLKQGGFVWA